MSNFGIYKDMNERAYDLQDPTGHVQNATVEDNHLITPEEYIVSLLPDI